MSCNNRYYEAKGFYNMRVHYLQHVLFEGLGCIEFWLQRQKAVVTRTRFFTGDFLPDPDPIDFVIAMGGPMSVNDESAFPWLKAEKRFLSRTMDLGIPVLGICLGAQLIAGALGARVFPNKDREIGWFPIQGVSNENAFRFPPRCTVFHWHGETFDLPAGAIRLARSHACENQAFQLGKNVIGLQFHLESTPHSVDRLIEHCRDELTPDPCVQSESEIKKASARYCRGANAIMESVLDFLTKTIG
jgi:GMP synthase-like glutamine amidotransferase